MMAPELMPKLLELLLELVPRAGTVALLQTLRGPPRSEYRIVGCAFPLFPYCRDDLRGDGERCIGILQCAWSRLSNQGAPV